jgi:acyl-coenzyme A thioesterase PaaI-like protein
MPPKIHVSGHDTRHVRSHRNFCFVCGKDNPHGMHLKFHLNEAGDRFVCRLKLPLRYWGPPRHAHGGIIATVLDEAMGKVNKLRHVIALTSRIEVNYLKPVPLGKPLLVESWESSVRGRRHVNVAEIRNDRGEVLARGRATFIAIDPYKTFAKHLPKAYRLGGFMLANGAPQARNGRRKTVR